MWNTTVSLFVFISTQTNVHTNRDMLFTRRLHSLGVWPAISFQVAIKDTKQGHHTRTSRTTTSSIWSSSVTISSRHILIYIHTKSSYGVVLYPLWNLCNNHPFLGDTVFLQVKHVSNTLSVFVLVTKQVMTFSSSQSVSSLSRSFLHFLTLS